MPGFFPICTTDHTAVCTKENSGNKETTCMIAKRIDCFLWILDYKSNYLPMINETDKFPFDSFPSPPPKYFKKSS